MVFTASVRQLAGPAAEAATAFAAAALMAWSSTTIEVDPLDRIGQVSGLAALQLRFALLGLLLLAGLLAVGRLRPGFQAHAIRAACAALAGLLGGLTAGGVVVALDGTRFGLGAAGGDVGVLQGWAADVLAGRGMPATYPPLMVYVLAAWSKLAGLAPAYAFKQVGIVGIACTPAVAYLAWRPLLPPLWALGIGVVASIPVAHPYKPYEALVLIALVPAFALFLRTLAGEPPEVRRTRLVVGAAFGLAFAMLFLGYSGWFLWSAPGALAATALLFPWRAPGRRQRVELIAATVVAFLLLAHRHLWGLIGSAGEFKDSFIYFDVFTEPTYIAMWRDDMPGTVASWPPLGELGGVGLYTVVLAVGLGVALARGARLPPVLAAACFAAGAWLLRFALASRVYATGTVQLFPRTAAEILYCLLVLTGFAVYLIVRRHPSASVEPGSASRLTPAGVLASLILVFGSAGSATADRFMPADDKSSRLLAWYAQTARNLEGKCSEHTQPREAGNRPPVPADWRTCKPKTQTPVGQERQR